MRKLNAMLTPLIHALIRCAICHGGARIMLRAATKTFLLLSALLCFPLTGCAEKTVGQQFREIMADIDAQCKKDKMGPYLDESDPGYRDKRAQTSCDILKIKPADPLATEEGRFAYSIKLPAPHDKPMVQYQKGMSAESYFKQLCEKEEGDFVFRTVDGVDGIKIMRPMPMVTGVPLWDETEGTPPGYFVDPNNGIYQYVDAVELVAGSQTDTQLIHYFIDPKLPAKVPPYGKAHYPVKQSTARYGFTFRNSPLESRELGIRGRELIILDLKTNEVMAIRRRFSKLNFVIHQSAQLMQGTPCRLLNENLNDKFIARILMPAAQAKGDSK